MKSLIRLAIVAAAGGLALFFSGCASVPLATGENDARAKEFRPDPDLASLYIYRSEVFGAAVPMTISVNNRVLGRTASKTFFFVQVPPGTYSIESIAENVERIEVTVAAGRNTFVWEEVKMGMMSARSRLHLVDENTGRAGVWMSHQIASMTPDSELVPLGGMMAAAPAPRASAMAMQAPTLASGPQPEHVVEPAPQPAPVAAPAPPQPSPTEILSEKLQDLEIQHYNKTITDAEYQAKRAELIKQSGK